MSKEAINEMFDSIQNRDKIEEVANLWKEYVIDQNLSTSDLLKCRKALDIQFALERTIEQIQIALEKIISCNTSKPFSISMSNDMWNDIQEQRHEILSNFLSNLIFIRDHPDMEMSI